MKNRRNLECGVLTMDHSKFEQTCIVRGLQITTDQRKTEAEEFESRRFIACVDTRILVRPSVVGGARVFSGR
jgi:hypothetical protein